LNFEDEKILKHLEFFISLIHLKFLIAQIKLNNKHLLSNGRNIGKNPAPPSGRLFSHCGKIGKIFKNIVFLIEILFYFNI
jgi:hypothetical protein